MGNLPSSIERVVTFGQAYAFGRGSFSNIEFDRPIEQLVDVLSDSRVLTGEIQLRWPMAKPGIPQKVNAFGSLVELSRPYYEDHLVFVGEKPFSDQSIRVGQLQPLGILRSLFGELEVRNSELLSRRVREIDSLTLPWGAM